MPGAVVGGPEPGWWLGVLGLAWGCCQWGWLYRTPRTHSPLSIPPAHPASPSPLRDGADFPAPAPQNQIPPPSCTGG